MKCEKCMIDIALDARFCPNCGEKVQMYNEGMNGNEVSIEWLINILKKLGYDEIEINSDGTGFSGKHKERYNINIILNRALKLITISFNFKLDQKNTSDGYKLQNTAMKANSLSLLGIFSLTDGNKALNTTSHINLTETIIERDIVVYLDNYEKNIVHLMETSGLMEMCGIILPLDA